MRIPTSIAADFVSHGVTDAELERLFRFELPGLSVDLRNAPTHIIREAVGELEKRTQWAEIQLDFLRGLLKPELVANERAPI